MILYFNLGTALPVLIRSDKADAASAGLAPVSIKPSSDAPTSPSPWMKIDAVVTLCDLDTEDGREKLATLLKEVPLYRITLELLIDKILFEALSDEARMKGVRKAFAPEDVPEAVTDGLAQKYAFAGVLRFPGIATRSESQLIALYLKLFGAAVPEHATIHAHLASMIGGYPERLMERCDGFIWRGDGWVRLERLIYDSERTDHDPDITYESYVTRGRTAAEALATGGNKTMLAAWVQAERVQQELARDIDAVLSMPGIRKLPRWVRGDVFRILEREAMKQVFAEGLVKAANDWPELRRNRPLMDAIEANARGEVAPLIQQLLNQTLGSEAQYGGSAGAFALQAVRRRAEAERLI